MRMSGSTIFITGGTSGIGRGLAGAFHERGNQVIVSGRREDRLRELSKAHPGMRYHVLDVADAAAIREVAAKAIAETPAIDCVINNAGVQVRFDFAPGKAADEGAILEEINVNLVGAIRVAAAFIPHLSGRPGATLVNVSSGLAFVPMAGTPVYCATKAAIHAWTLCLRRQLRDTGIRVIELIPPFTATELGGPGKLAWSRARGREPMALDAFIAETMRELEADAGADEIAVGEAKRLFAAAGAGKVREVFSAMNP
jgi:uncharacterized oxidoreductase